MLDEMNISFSVPPQCILLENSSGESPGGQWLPGAYVNPAKNCLSLNCKRTLDDTVIRWRDEGSDELPLSSMTLDELRTEVWYAAFRFINFVHYARGMGCLALGLALKMFILDAVEKKHFGKMFYYFVVLMT